MKRIPEMLAQVIFWTIISWAAGIVLKNFLDAAIMAIGGGSLT